MLRISLQWIGLLFLIGLAATGIGALSLVKDRIDVTVRSADQGNRPDPLALVRDELQQLHLDLQAIAQGLDINLRAVGEAIDASTQRDLALQQQVTELAKARSPERLEAALLGLRGELASLRDGIGAQSLSEPETERQPEDLEVSQNAGECEVIPSEPVDQAPETRQFLSFSLPSSTYAFDAPQHYRIIPDLSRVGFDAKSTLHDFSGVTSSIRGDVQANLADPAGKWHGSIHCNAGALRTGVDGRDENMREYLVTDKHPEISFELTGFAPDPNGIDVAGRTASGMVKGRMTIRGRTRDVEMPVAISIDESRRVAISGQMPLHLPDYEVPVPSQLGLISMDEEVMVWVELRARSVGAAEEAPDGR